MARRVNPFRAPCQGSNAPDRRFARSGEDGRFEVHALRRAMRVRPNGRVEPEAIVSLIQSRTVAADSGIEPRRVRWSPDGGSLFYVMPWVQGETLQERIHREKQLSIEDALGRILAEAVPVHTLMSTDFIDVPNGRQLRCRRGQVWLRDGVRSVPRLSRPGRRLAM